MRTGITQFLENSPPGAFGRGFYRRVPRLPSKTPSDALCAVPFRRVPHRRVPYRRVPYRRVPSRRVPYRRVPSPVVALGDGEGAGAGGGFLRSGWAAAGPQGVSVSRRLTCSGDSDCQVRLEETSTRDMRLMHMRTYLCRYRPACAGCSGARGVYRTFFVIGGRGTAAGMLLLRGSW